VKKIRLRETPSKPIMIEAFWSRWCSIDLNYRYHYYKIIIFLFVNLWAGWLATFPTTTKLQF